MRPLRGLTVIGQYIGTKPAQKRDGTIVPGLHKLSIDQGTIYPVEVSYSVEDRETGDETPISKQLRESAPEKGDLVAVRVASSASGQYVNLTALSIRPFFDPADDE
jgi:hypothetical protein